MGGRKIQVIEDKQIEYPNQPVTQWLHEDSLVTVTDGDKEAKVRLFTLNTGHKFSFEGRNWKVLYKLD